MYTTIIHPLRKAFNLSCNEYCVLDTIYNLSNNTDYGGWCIKTKYAIADDLGMSIITIKRALDTLEQFRLIDRVHGKIKASNFWRSIMQESKILTFSTEELTKKAKLIIGDITKITQEVSNRNFDENEQTEQTDTLKVSNRNFESTNLILPKYQPDTFTPKYIIKDSIKDNTKDINKEQNNIIKENKESLEENFELNVLKKVSDKKNPIFDTEKINSKLLFVHQSTEFMSKWTTLIKEPKWKKKTITALQTCLDILGKETEQDAIQMVIKSIAGGWQGVFPLKQSDKKGTFDPNQTGNRQESVLKNVIKDGKYNLE